MFSEDESMTNPELAHLFEGVRRFTSVSELIKFYEFKQKEEAETNADPVQRTTSHPPFTFTTSSFSLKSSYLQKQGFNPSVSSEDSVSIIPSTDIRQTGLPVQSLIQSFEDRVKAKVHLQKTKTLPVSSTSKAIYAISPMSSQHRSSIIQSTPVRVNITSTHLKETRAPSIAAFSTPRFQPNGSTTHIISVFSKKADYLVPPNAITVEAVTAVISAAARNHGIVPSRPPFEGFNVHTASYPAVDHLRQLAGRNGDVTKYRALLKWCQNRLKCYRGVKVMNFSFSWNDGLALCALFHTYVPQLIAENWAEVVDKMNEKERFELAFKVAESLGIPTTLDSDEMATNRCPKWARVMSYIASIYRRFEVYAESTY
nr:cytospin a [Hymenolepis microstoma]